MKLDGTRDRGCFTLDGRRGMAFAATKAAALAGAAAGGGGDENTTYKAKTVYDFEDDMVEGDLQRPDGELVNALKKTEHSSLSRSGRTSSPRC